MILHIPHSSDTIPRYVRDQFVLSGDELAAELNLMTDAFTDELFVLAEASVVRFPFSRLVVDVERFPDDAEEPMSRVGMGAIYTLTASGIGLRRSLDSQETKNLMALHGAHHQAVLRLVENELLEHGHALIVDCHSFPSHPLPCDRDQSIPRPDLCIGTDSFHTPEALARSTALNIRKMGYTVRMDRPYEGTVVPTVFRRKDRRVASVMIEVNRRLYMDETAGAKTGAFDSVKEQIRSLLSSVKEYEEQARRDARGGR